MKGNSEGSPRFILGVVHGRPAPGEVPDAGLAGGSAGHVDHGC